MGWNDGVQTIKRTDILTENKLIQANFEKKYNLVYKTCDPASGAVDTMLQSVYHGGDSALVTATPSNGYYFTGWSDGVLTPSRIERSVVSDMCLTANFSNVKTLIYVARNGGNVINFSGIVDIGSSTGTVTADSKTVTGTGFLSSIAVNDYICVGTIFYQVKSIESNTSLTLYTAASANSTSFKIIKQNRLISRTGGSNISILPLPADGYHFSGWSDGKSNNSDNTRSDTLVDAVVYANFAQKYTISYISSEGDSTVSSSSAGGTVVLG